MLEAYRPFLSYNELGSMLDERPSKLYDALSKVPRPRRPQTALGRNGRLTNAAKGL